MSCRCVLSCWISFSSSRIMPSRASRIRRRRRRQRLVVLVERHERVAAVAIGTAERLHRDPHPPPRAVGQVAMTAHADHLAGLLRAEQRRAQLDAQLGQRVREQVQRRLPAAVREEPADAGRHVQDELLSSRSAGSAARTARARGDASRHATAPCVPASQPRSSACARRSPVGTIATPRAGGASGLTRYSRARLSIGAKAGLVGVGRFGRAEEQVAVAAQREAEDLEHAALRLGLQVDQQIAAGDEVSRENGGSRSTLCAANSTVSRIGVATRYCSPSLTKKRRRRVGDTSATMPCG